MTDQNHGSSPLFSIIIPLEFHRGKFDHAWQAWQRQDIDSTLLEIILMIPPGFEDHGILPTANDRRVRVQFSEARHDIALCAEGASIASGRYLFFTESHCWPRPDVLSRCLRAFEQNHDWAAFSCGTVRVVHNRLSIAEAKMYQDDIEDGMMLHPWKKVLDHGFATKREAYDACGGFRPEFGHYSEWVLAASYFEKAYKVGFLRDATMEHYYVGSLAPLSEFTRDFVEGEISYFSSNANRAKDVLEPPPEWVSRGNFDQTAARRIFFAVVDSLQETLTRPLQLARLITLASRWSIPAFLGDRVACSMALIEVWLRWIMLRLDPRQSVIRSFKSYIAALIKYQRLTSVRKLRDAHQPGFQQIARDFPAVPNGTGFHLLETYGDRKFRWSEPAACLEFQAPRGRYRLHLTCLPVRTMLANLDLRIYLDGRRIPPEAIRLSRHAIEIDIELTTPGAHTLLWICRAFKGKHDRRKLGLPIVNFDLLPWKPMSSTR